MAGNSVIPMLAYEDAAAAIDWFVKAFGFREKLRYIEEDGTVTHAELVTIAQVAPEEWGAVEA